MQERVDCNLDDLAIFKAPARPSFLARHIIFPSPVVTRWVTHHPIGCFSGAPPFLLIHHPSGDNSPYVAPRMAGCGFGCPLRPQ